MQLLHLEIHAFECHVYTYIYIKNVVSPPHEAAASQDRESCVYIYVLNKTFPSLYGAAASRDRVPNIRINALKTPLFLHLELLHLEIESHVYTCMYLKHYFSSIWSRCISRSMPSSAARAVHCTEMVLNVWRYTYMYV